MNTDTIVALHRASKTAALLWFSLRIRNVPGAWFVAVITFGLFIAVRVLVYAHLVAQRAVRPWQ